MKKLILILSIFFIAGCGPTVYHKKYGRVSNENGYFKRDVRSCYYKEKKLKKYRNYGEFKERVSICMINKGWRP